MANHPGGGGGFDPRYNNGQFGNNAQYNGQQYNTFYDPRYQQQPYSYQTQNVQVQVPMGNYAYNGVPQQHQMMQQSPSFAQQSPPMVHQPSPVMSQPSPILNQRNYHQNQQHQQQQQHQHQHQHQQQRQPQQQQQQQFYPQTQYRQQQMQSPQLQNTQIQSPQFSSPQIRHAQAPPHHVSSQQRQQPLPRPMPHSSPPPIQQSPPLAQQRPPAAVRTAANGHFPSPKIKRPSVSQAPRQNTPPTRPAAPPAPPLPPPLEIDYSRLCMDLADRFFEEAYGSESGKGRQTDPDVFAKLISSGLACLDTILRKHKSSLQPSQEAAIRLRYASILCSETQNYMDAEEMLSKGISLCDRYHFTSHKYNMQHLLARVTYSKNPKAAARYADGLIRDAEAVHHTPWLYAFRFLRVALGLRIATNQEILNATTQLRLVATTASSRKHQAVAAVASATEALLHLTYSSGNEGIEQAQRALASSRKAQLDSGAQAIRQLSVMTMFVDLICSILQNNPNETTSKMVETNKFLDENAQSDSWGNYGEFLVPVSGVRESDASASAGGVVHVDTKGSVHLRVKWMPKDEIYALAYLLSSSTMMHKNAQDGGKAEAFLKEANGVLARSQKRAGQPFNSWEKPLSCQIKIQNVFALCGRSYWKVAENELNTTKAKIDALQSSAQGMLPVFVAFLEAVIAQGRGETNKALELYSQPPLSLYTTDLTHAPPAHHDIAVLAALNALLIVCLPSHPEHNRTTTLLATLEPLASEHPSKNIQAAYHLIRAVSLNATAGTSEMSAESASMLKTKQFLQNALQLAKRTANNQLCCITLNFMSFKYFRGVVGPQAQKSASSAEALAKKGQDALWTSVAHGLLAETLETQGKSDEAEKVRRDGLEEAKQLPQAMWRRGDEPDL